MNYETFTAVLVELVVYRMLRPKIDELAEILWMSSAEVKRRLGDK